MTVSNVLAISSDFLVAAGTIYLGLMAYRSLRQDSVPRLRIRLSSAYDGFFHVALVNSGKVPVFVESLDIEGTPVGKIEYDIVSIQEIPRKYYLGELEPHSDPATKRHFPYPLVGGEKVEVIVELEDCEDPKERVYGPEDFLRRKPSTWLRNIAIKLTTALTACVVNLEVQQKKQPIHIERKKCWGILS